MRDENNHATSDELLRDAALGKAYQRWYGAAKGYRGINADAAHEAILHDAGNILAHMKAST